MVGDERGRDVGPDVERSARRPGCVETVHDGLFGHTGQPEPCLGSLVPRGVERRRVERLVGTYAHSDSHAVHSPGSAGSTADSHGSCIDW
jgi:hypothetical protein